MFMAWVFAGVNNCKIFKTSGRMCRFQIAVEKVVGDTVGGVLCYHFLTITEDGSQVKENNPNSYPQTAQPAKKPIKKPQNSMNI